MKIILLTDKNIFNVTSASSNRWRTMIQGLLYMGAELHMIITQGYESYDELRKFGLSGKHEGINYYYNIVLLKNNIWMRRIAKYIISSSIAIPINVMKTKHLIRSINPDIVFLRPSYDVFLIYNKIYKKFDNLKYMTELNEFSDVPISYSNNRFQYKTSIKFDEMLKKTVLPNIHFCIVMTKVLLKYYLKFCNNSKISFLHLPMTVDFSRFSINYRSETNEITYIAYCGSSSFRKDGVDIMIKSFKNITLQYPNLKLKIASFKGKDVNTMLALIHSLGLESNVDYIDSLDRKEIPGFLSSAKLLLLPRPDSHQASGGFPTKLGEYLATGNPVCATTVGEIPDYLVDDESVFFAKPGSIESFADAMHRALIDPENATRVGENGRAVAAKHFDKDVQSKRLYKFLIEKLERNNE